MPDWDFKTIEFYRDAEDGMKRKHRINLYIVILFSVVSIHVNIFGFYFV